MPVSDTLSTSPVIPGPVNIPLLGYRVQGLNMLRDPVRFFMTMYERYGLISAWARKDPKFVNVFGPYYNRLLLSNPDAFIVDAFRESKLPKGSSFEKLTVGLLRLNGSAHQRQRKLLLSAFRSIQMEAHWDTIVDVTATELGRWKTGETRCFDVDMFRLITFISMRTMFGADSECEGDRLLALISKLIKLASLPLTIILPLNMPGLPFRSILRVTGDIEDFVRTAIAGKANALNQSSDVLSELISARDESGYGFSEDELIAHAYTVLCQDNVAAAITWTLLLLDRHPAVLRDLLSELRTELGGSPPTVTQVGRLELLDLVIKESLRLFPPAAFGLRYASDDCDLGSYQIKKNTGVFYSSFVSHRLPEIYAEPLAFEPLRWQSIKPTAYEYIPFGAGSHSCVGHRLADLEIKVILSMILQRFRLTVTPGSKIDLGFKISMVPKPALRVAVDEYSIEFADTPERIIGNFCTGVKLVG